jgi:hypothetical protein
MIESPGTPFKGDDAKGVVVQLHKIAPSPAPAGELQAIGLISLSPASGLFDAKGFSAEGPGRYEGVLLTNPSRGEPSAVRLRLLVTHHWFMPAAAVLVGAVLGLVASPRLASTYEYRRRVHDLRRALVARSRTIVALRLHGQRLVPWNLEGIVELACEGVLTRLSQVARTVTIGIGADAAVDLGSIASSIQDLERSLTALHTIESSVRAIAHQGEVLPEMAEAPNFVAAALERVSDLNALTTRSQELATVEAVLPRFRKACAALDGLEAEIKKALPGVDETVLRTLREQARVARRALWEASIEGIDRAAIDIEGLGATIQGILAPTTKAAEASGGQTFRAGKRDPVKKAGGRSRIDAVKDSRSCWVLNCWAWEIQGRLSSWWIVDGWYFALLAVGLASCVWLGLESLYFDRPFGTGRDYGRAFMFGVAGGAISQLLAKLSAAVGTPLAGPAR